MKYLKENYRLFTDSRFVYMAEGSAVEVSAETKTEKASEKPVEKMASKGAKPGEIWDTTIEPKYGPDIYETKIRTFFEKTYQEAIKASADKVMPEGVGIIDKEDLIKRSIEKYSETYNTVLTEFLDKNSKLYADKEAAEKEIKKDARNKRKLLRDAIEHGTEAQEKQKKIDNISLKFKKWLDKQNVLKYSSKLEVRRKFEAYVDAMNDHYLNLDWQKARLRPSKGRTWGIPIFYPKFSRNKVYKYYKERAKYFKKGMVKKVDANLKYMLSFDTTNKETLKTLQKQIEDEYKKYASLDKRPGMIDVEDLGMLEKLGSPSLDMLALMNTTGDNADKNILEAIHLMNPDAWEDAMERAEATIINDAISNGAEGKFIEAANKWREEKEGKKDPLKTFSEAEDYFEDTMKTYTKMGVNNTYAFIMHFNEVVNAHRIEILESVSPKFIKNLAYRERERMLSRRLVPDRKGDQVVVEFVSANREGREKILAERRDELLKEIKNIQKHYPKASKDFRLNKKNITTNSRNREKPTAFDKAARLQALIMISKEAEWVVRNFSTLDEYKNQNLAENLDAVSADKEPIYAGWKLKDTRKSRYTPYKSALSRGGFNGRDLAMTGLKVMGAMTVLANVANSIRTADGTGFFETAADAVGKIVSNPGVAVGVAVTAGAHTLQMNPEYYGFLRESKYGRLEIDSTRKLRSLSSRAGRSYVKKFVHNDSEWAVMDELKAGQQIKSLMKKASKEKPPHIKKSDLPAPIKNNKEIMTGLPDDFNTAHLRYQFYRKFLLGREKPNINQLKTVCQTNKIVS